VENNLLSVENTLVSAIIDYNLYINIIGATLNPHFFHLYLYYMDFDY